MNNIHVAVQCVLLLALFLHFLSSCSHSKVHLLELNFFILFFFFVHYLLCGLRIVRTSYSTFVQWKHQILYWLSLFYYSKNKCENGTYYHGHNHKQTDCTTKLLYFHIDYMGRLNGKRQTVKFIYKRHTQTSE